MAAFMGLFRRWLDHSEEDDENNNNQRQSNPGDGSDEDTRESEMTPSVKLEPDREKLLETEIERLEAELESAKEEAMDLQRQYFEGLATKESESKRLSIVLKEQIDDLNNRWMTERRNFEQLEKKTEVQKTKQQQQLQTQQESNARKVKELQDTITRLNKVTAEQRTEMLSLRNGFQRTLNAKEADCNKLNQQLIEVNRRLEDEVKASMTEQKRREMAEASLESQAEKIKHMGEQNKIAVRCRKETNELQVTVDQLRKELANEKWKVTEVEEERNQVLTSIELDRKRFEKEMTQLNKRFESQSRALQEAKQARQELQMQIREQKKIESQKDKAMIAEKIANELLEIQLQEQKDIECQKDNALEMETKARKELQVQLHEQKNIECQKDNALEMEKRAKEELQMQLQEQKNIESQKGSALEMEKKAREELQMQLREQKKIESQKNNVLEKEKKAREELLLKLQEQKKIECEKDNALEMEKKAREELQMQLQEQKKIESQKDKALEELQLKLQEQKKIGCVNDNTLEAEKNAWEELELHLQQLKDIDFHKDEEQQTSIKQFSTCEVEILRNEVETQTQRNVLLEKDHQELVIKANSDCEGLRAAVAELQHRLQTQAKNYLIEKKKGEELEKQFQWQSGVIKHQDCQLATTRKELNELKEMFSQRGIELSNEILKNAYVDINHRTFIDVKDQECKEFERELTEVKEKLHSQTQLLSIEREKRELVSQTLEDQKKHQLEIEEQHKEQLTEVKERLTMAEAREKNYREDAGLENQKLLLELSVVRDKLERGTKELEKEKQVRLEIQQQRKQLTMERDEVMGKAVEEKEKLMNRITELEIEKRCGTEKSGNQTKQPCQGDETHPKNWMNAEPIDTNTSHVMQEQEVLQSEEVEMLLLAQSAQLKEQLRRISELSEALEEEKQKNLKLKIQSGHFRSQRDKIIQQLQFVQQMDRQDQQMSLEQQKQNMEPTIKVTEDLRDSQEKINPDSQTNWKLDDNTKETTIDAKAETGEDGTASNRLNQLRLDDNKIQELRERMKTLQRLGDKAVSCTEVKVNEPEHEKEKKNLSAKIKGESVDTKYEANQTQFASPPLEEVAHPPTKRRRLENSISIDDSAPYDQLTTGVVRVIEIKPDPDIKQEPIEEQLVKTKTIKNSNERKEPGPITNQEPRKGAGPSIEQEPQTGSVVNNRRRLMGPSTVSRVSGLVASIPVMDASVSNDVGSSGSNVDLFPEEEARLIQTLRPHWLSTPVTGVAVLKGSIYIVSEMNSVVEVYDSTTFTFSGKVSVEGLKNPQSLTSCPINSCLYILNRAQPSNDIYRQGFAPHWRHFKWSIGTDCGALASTPNGSLLLSCFDDLRIKEFSSNGKLIRQFRFGQQSASELRLLGAVQLPTTTGETSDTSAVEPSFAISYTDRRTGLRRVCTIDGRGQVVNPLLRYNGNSTNQHLIVGRQTGALFLADFGMGEVLQWNSELKNCRTLRRRKEERFRPLRVCLDENEKIIIIAETSLTNDGSGMNKLSIYDL